MVMKGLSAVCFKIVLKTRTVDKTVHVLEEA